MSDYPEVSVIMNCFNGAEYLREAIDSVYSQTFSNWEIIFWDNASNDDSPKIARSYDSKLRYFRGEKTVPIGEARNYALQKTRGQYIAFLDCDDLWYPSKLEKQVPFFKNNPEVGVVYSDCNIIDENGQITMQDIMNGQFYEGNVFEHMFKNMIVPAWPTVVMRKSSIDDVGMFANYSRADDLDILLKIAYVSSFAAAKETLASYRVNSNQLSKYYYKFLPEFISIYDYWSNRPDFNYPNKLQYISYNLSKQYCLCAESAFDLSDSIELVREYLCKALRMSFSIKIFVLFCLSWLGLPKARYFVKHIRSLLNRYR
jgi:glycosyltransferase involved in cell wall biosynthesis